MKRISLFLIALLFTFTLFAQDIIPHVTALIRVRDYKGANHYLDSILKKKPREVDALMMKGNIALNRSYDTLPNVLLINERTESIFDTSVTAVQAGIKIIPATTVAQVEKLWKQCLLIDTTRNDIREGLCSVYAMALMKPKLKAEILQLLKHNKEQGEDYPYKIADYARKFKERGRFDEAIEIYQFIANQYPTLAGIRSDIAWEFFYEGRMKQALQYIDSALSKPNIDESTYVNCAFAYSELGYFEDAYKVFSRFSQQYNTKMDVFYRGLMEFSEANEAYSNTLESFVSMADSNSYYNEYKFAQAVLLCKDTFTLSDYQRLTSGGQPEWYLPLIYQRAIKTISNCNAYIDYGLYQNKLKNFTASVSYLQKGEVCELRGDERRIWLLNYAYALYMMGEKEKAKKHFNLLFQLSNTFAQQAAKYFVAKMLLSDKNVDLARQIAQQISTAKQKTKYTELSHYLFRSAN